MVEASVCIGLRASCRVRARPAIVARMTLGEQRRNALELLAPPPSRHDHSDGGIPRQSGQRFEQAFHNRCRKGVEPIRPIKRQRRDAIRNLLDEPLFYLDAPP